jgi:hypothetical protein
VSGPRDESLIWEEVQVLGNRRSLADGSGPFARFSRTAVHPAALRAVQLALVLACAGCTLAPTVNVPTEDIKEAATDLSAGARGAAEEVRAGLGEAGGKLGEQYREEIRAASKDLSAMAKSVNDLVAYAKESPAVFGDAIAQRLVQEEAIQSTLKSVAALAKSQERVAAAGTEVPKILADKITEFQEALASKEGFLSQQRAAILDELRKERMAIAETIRRERIDAMKGLDALASNAINETGAQIQRIIGSALGLTILLVIVMWGLPFAAGFLVGRVWRRKAEPLPPPPDHSHAEDS